jgi:mono/diheme cytochrome c family protein
VSSWLRTIPLCLILLLCSCTTASPDPTEETTGERVQPTGITFPTATTTPLSISGLVLDGSSPIANAIVRIQATDLHAISAEDGSFTLELEDPGVESYLLTGWASGYFCSGPFSASVGDQEVLIQLARHADDDYEEYHWLPSRFYPGEGEGQGCAECHSREGTNLPFSLPVDEWLLDAHAQSATNPRFISMYNGTDLDGNQSPLTSMGYSRDYGSFPLPPDPQKPYYGPGYKLDFPESAGNCSACHTPAAAVNEPYSTDPNRLSGVEAEGLPCDFCHKVWDVKLDPHNALPYPNMPGVLSLEFRRPHEGHQFFAGPLDDVAPGEDTYSEVQTQSAYCAACHFGVFWDTTIYNSYGEWLQSPYSDPITGQTCQDCHMPPLGGTQFATDEAGGLTRDPETIFSHRMPGALDQDFLEDALEMRVFSDVDAGNLSVTVSLYNDNTGHKIPTDSPLRHMLLIVEAFDLQEVPLEFVEGPTLPLWAGEGSTEEGYYAALPGKAYALVLEELWTEISPSGAYWNPTRVVTDTRLNPFEEDVTRYTYELPDNKVAEVHVRLLLRRAFIDLMDQKGWTDPDILMGERVIAITP